MVWSVNPNLLLGSQKAKLPALRELILCRDKDVTIVHLVK